MNDTPKMVYRSTVIDINQDNPKQRAERYKKYLQELQGKKNVKENEQE